MNAEQLTPNPRIASTANTPYFPEIPEPFNLTFFYICNDADKHQSIVSALFATKEQAEAAKTQLLEHYPDCYLCGGTAYYHGEDDSNRLELLAAIQHTTEQTALLDQLQQKIERTRSLANGQHTEAIDRIQETHDYLMAHSNDGGIEQMTGILTIQLDEILATLKPG